MLLASSDYVKLNMSSFAVEVLTRNFTGALSIPVLCVSVDRVMTNSNRFV